jgi:serine/threonine protein phosphatase PrpC
MLTDERILHVAMPHRYNPLLSAQALIRTALEAGGIDNVTVIVCTITDTPDPSDRR